MDIKEIRRAAEEELAQEDRRKAIDAEKLRIRNRRAFWSRWFPWRLRIVKV